MELQRAWSGQRKRHVEVVLVACAKPPFGSWGSLSQCQRRRVSFCHVSESLRGITVRQIACAEGCRMCQLALQSTIQPLVRSARTQQSSIGLASQLDPLVVCLVTRLMYRWHFQLAWPPEYVCQRVRAFAVLLRVLRSSQPRRRFSRGARLKHPAGMDVP